MTLDPEFLKILACPECKTPLREHGETLVCAACSRAYPVRDGVPVLVVAESVKTAS